MDLLEQFNKLFPSICEWAREQEDRVLRYGVPLNEDQKIDAYLVGVKDIEKVRLLEVNEIPRPQEPELLELGEKVGLLSPQTLGVTYRYGIFIKRGYLNERNLVVHELVHTMQYERIGSFDQFLKEYLRECVIHGYPYGELEMEARNLERKICG